MAADKCALAQPSKWNLKQRQHTVPVDSITNMNHLDLVTGQTSTVIIVLSPATTETKTFLCSEYCYCGEA